MCDRNVRCGSLIVLIPVSASPTPTGLERFTERADSKTREFRGVVLLTRGVKWFSCVITKKANPNITFTVAPLLPFVYVCMYMCVCVLFHP